MIACSKRAKSPPALMSGSISPPLSKKRKVSDRLPNDQPQQRSDSHGICIYAWNVNGIQPFIQPSLDRFVQKRNPQRSASTAAPAVRASLRDFLRRHRWPHVLNLQEVKISPSDTTTQRSVEAAVNNCRASGPDDGPRYIVRFCLPRDKFNATGFGRKVYGVACIIREDFFDKHVERVREVNWDLEGRILVIETYSKLAIWNVYAVNGTTYAYKDPATGREAGTRHDRKLQFHDLLVRECKRLESDGWRVVITGDLNVARAPEDGHPRLRTTPSQHVENRRHFNAKFFEDPGGLGAIDSFRELHPERRSYSWMSRNRPWMASCDRVDYILLSKGLRGELVDADVLMSPDERGHSDHFPIYVKLAGGSVGERPPPDNGSVHPV